MTIKYYTATLSILCMASTVFYSAQTAAEATGQSTVINEDGSFTYIQEIGADSTPPHYTAPQGYGFSIYSWFNEDYGWQHDFPLWNDDEYKIVSATLLIRGWDVDSEPHHGTGGEYDGIAVDGVDLNPGLLQGNNNSWSETHFTVPIEAISDDGLINVFLDIDMNHSQRTWATTLDYSLLTINYIRSNGQPPFKPLLSITPNGATGTDDDLVVSVVGPTPADPDNDPVSYSYRWYVDVGQGYFVDDEFAGKADHNGPRVPANQTTIGETWKVEVYPSDSENLAGSFANSTWYTIGDADNDGVLDDSDDYPDDAERAFINYFPANGQNTLAFEDRWPHKGDYDMNDVVLYYSYSVISNSENAVKQIVLDADLVARGGDQASGFAISLAGVDSGDVDSVTLTINGLQQSISAEAGHSGELIYVLIDNTLETLPGNGVFGFYNTQDSDERNAVPIRLDVSFKEAVPVAALGLPPYNPFIFASDYRGREIHLRNQPPTDLADVRIFSTGDDVSVAENGHYYRTSDNLPWALDINGTWKHPLERIDILVSYPDMPDWVESSGTVNMNWYLSPRAGKCWKCR